jgi:putative peptidoglycan lipid II flippase
MSENRNKTTEGVMKAAGILMVMNFIASILGYARQIIISHYFGANAITDAYYNAFRIPDVIYNVLVGGGLSSAFIPVFSSYLADNDDDNGFRMASTVLNLVAIVSCIASVIGIIFAPQLLTLILDMDSGAIIDLPLTVKLTRIMFFQSFFMCLTGICMGILQAYKHFAPPSIGSVVYNLVIIVMGIVLMKLGLGIMGFSIGVVLGAAAHLGIQIFYVRKKKFKYYKIIDLENTGVSKFFHLFWPMLLGISVSQINTVVNSYFGSGQGQSIITAMTQAISLQQLPINMFGFSIAISVFPTMVEHYSQGKIKHYKKDLSMAVRNMVFITLPATFGLIAVREPLVRAFFLHGEFNETNLHTLSTLMIFYCAGITAYCVRQVLLQGFYSIQITSIPVTINIIVLILNVIFSFFFVKILGANGLGLAYSLAGFCSMTMLIVMLRTKVGGIRGKEILNSVIRIAIACVIMYLMILLGRAVLENILPMESKLAQLIELMFLIGFGGLTYLIAAYILRIRELKSALSLVLRKFNKRIAAETVPEDDDEEEEN